MTRVDFYLSDDDGPRAAPVLACRLAEKAWKLGHKVYLHTGGPTEAQKIDELLWTFRDVSFVPHALAGTDDTLSVQVGHGEPPAGFEDTLVNLAAEVPPFFSKFERVAEVVGGDEDGKKLGRARFKFYRDRGYELETHEV